MEWLLGDLEEPFSQQAGPLKHADLIKTFTRYLP